MSKIENFLFFSSANFNLGLLGILGKAELFLRVLAKADEMSSLSSSDSLEFSFLLLDSSFNDELD